MDDGVVAKFVNTGMAGFTVSGWPVALAEVKLVSLPLLL
jgi:hypothetical protein